MAAIAQREVPLPEHVDVFHLHEEAPPTEDSEATDFVVVPPASAAQPPRALGPSCNIHRPFGAVFVVAGIDGHGPGDPGVELVAEQQLQRWRETSNGCAFVMRNIFTEPDPQDTHPRLLGEMDGP